jgi:hypothetical protein
MGIDRREFESFVLCEHRAYLGQKVGDVLTATQELRDDGPNMGTRDLTKFSEKIANQIRRILHSQWPKEEQKHLKVLQKAAVAIMKAIDEKDDLQNVISSTASELEKLTGDLGVPVNKFASSDTAPPDNDKGTADAVKPQPKQQQQEMPAGPQAPGQANPLQPPAPDPAQAGGTPPMM